MRYLSASALMELFINKEIHLQAGHMMNSCTSVLDRVELGSKDSIVYWCILIRKWNELVGKSRICEKKRKLQKKPYD